MEDMRVKEQFDDTIINDCMKIQEACHEKGDIANHVKERKCRRDLAR